MEHIVLPYTSLGRMAARALGVELPADEWLHITRPATPEERRMSGTDTQLRAYPYAFCGGQPLHIQGRWPLLNERGVCPTCAAANRGMWEVYV